MDKCLREKLVGRRFRTCGIKEIKLLLAILIFLLVSVGHAFSQVKVKSDLVKVTQVIDGDTIEVQLRGETKKVRLIGVAAPKLKNSNKRMKCFAYGALGFTEFSLLGRTVTLEADDTQADNDKDGSLLRYVFWENDNFNLYIIKKGFAYEYTYGKPYKYQKEFKEAEKYAEESKWGLWDKNECK